jgi:hypothetical protein
MILGGSNETLFILPVPCNLFFARRLPTDNKYPDRGSSHYFAFQCNCRPSALTNIPMQIGYGVSGPWFELYFTDPTNPAKKQETGGPDEPLVAS